MRLPSKQRLLPGIFLRQKLEEIWMSQSIWQSLGESGPIEDAGIFPRGLQEEFSLQQKFFPVETCLNVRNMLVFHPHS